MRRAAAVILMTAWTLLLLAGPAFAENPLGPSEGAEPGESMDLVVAGLLYVVLPLTVFAIVAAIVWLPGALKANRYRPTRPWLARPVWFAGPADPVSAVQSAQVGDVVRGGSGGSW